MITTCNGRLIKAIEECEIGEKLPGFLWPLVVAESLKKGIIIACIENSTLKRVHLITEVEDTALLNEIDNFSTCSSIPAKELEQHFNIGFLWAHIGANLRQ